MLFNKILTVQELVEAVNHTSQRELNADVVTDYSKDDNQTEGTLTLLNGLRVYVWVDGTSLISLKLIVSDWENEFQGGAYPLKDENQRKLICDAIRFDELLMKLAKLPLYWKGLELLKESGADTKFGAKIFRKAEISCNGSSHTRYDFRFKNCYGASVESVGDGIFYLTLTQRSTEFLGQDRLYRTLFVKPISEYHCKHNFEADNIPVSPASRTTPLCTDTIMVEGEKSVNIILSRIAALPRWLNL